MNVGDTFFLNGEEFSIKNIDKTVSNRFPSGRIDASRFTGEVGNIENPRIIQRGRPRGFNLSDVAHALGEEFVASETTDIESTAEMESKWDSTKEVTTEEISKVFSDLDSAPFSNLDSDW